MSYKKHPAFGELMPISDVYERLSIGASSYTARQSQGLFPRHILDGRGKYLPVAEFEKMVECINAGATDAELRELVKTLHDARCVTPGAKWIASRHE